MTLALTLTSSKVQLHRLSTVQASGGGSYSALHSIRVAVADPADVGTLDPIEPSVSCAEEASPEVVVIDVLAHPDLRRVGDRSVVFEGRVDVGRIGPLFAPMDGGTSARSLDDPCVSRQQFSLSYDRVARRFGVTTTTAARRPLRVFDVHGRPIATDGSSIAPGCLVAVGDRLLLSVDVRSLPLTPPLGMIGRSRELDALRGQTVAYARLAQSVLIGGPSGAGKERIARALHGASARAGGPFVAINCAALPDALTEGELFGHVRGAFSGASGARDGLFVEADGGTLLLDEVGELPLSAQAKLLRVLQERRVRPLGGSGDRPVDVWVLAATHRDLRAEVTTGRFREDLYARLACLSLTVPALEARPTDVPLLFTSFLLRHAKDHPELARRWVRSADVRPGPVPMDFMLSLLGARWPLNIRGVEHLANHVAAAVLEHGTIDWGEWLSASEAEPAPAAPAIEGTRPSAEELRSVFEACEHVTQRVAKRLGVSHTTIDRWMRDVGILRPRDLPAEVIESALSEAEGEVRAAAKALQVSERGLRLRLRELGRLQL